MLLLCLTGAGIEVVQCCGECSPEKGLGLLLLCLTGAGIEVVQCCGQCSPEKGWGCSFDVLSVDYPSHVYIFFVVDSIFCFNSFVRFDDMSGNRMDHVKVVMFHPII